MRLILIFLLLSCLNLPAAPEAKKPVSVETPPTAGTFIGDKDSKIYYKAGCRKMTTGIKRKVLFSNKEEAGRAGFRACRSCQECYK